MNTKRNILLWISYDFANSIISIVFFLYFAQWIVIERGVADIWFNLTFSVAALLLLVSAPITGVLLDRYWRRIAGLRLVTAFTVLGYGLCALFAISGQTLPALAAFTLGMYFYLLSFTFYTPLLSDIATAEKRGKISGFGIAANYLGQIAGILLVLPIATGTVNFFNASPRAETLLPAVIVFFLLTLPMLLYFQEPPKERQTFSLGKEIKSTWAHSKKLIAYPGILAFFVAYFFFNDAILTAANNFSIFMEQVWRVSDSVKSYLLLCILVTSAIGGVAAGFIGDRLGHKRTLTYIIAGWIFILPAMALLTNFVFFIVVITLMGFWFGATWVVSRALMSHLAPAGGHNLAFAYFGLVERASSFVGPIVWGLIATGLVSMGPDRYRIAAISLTLFTIIGLIALLRVRSDAT